MSRNGLSHPIASSLVQDFRSALRSLSRARGYTLTIALSLGMAMGLAVSVFGVARPLWLAALPFDDSDRIVRLRQHALEPATSELNLSVPEIQEYAKASSLQSVAEYHSTLFRLEMGDRPTRARCAVVSASYFDIFRVRPELGRVFTAGDESPTAEPVAVLSHDSWTRGFGADPGALGRQFHMNGRLHTVIGVLPRLPPYPNSHDLYITTAASPMRSDPSVATNPRARLLLGFAVLANGRTAAEAARELSERLARLREAHPEAYPRDSVLVVRPESLQGELTQEVRPTMVVAGATAACLMLVVCVNLVNLALARNAARRSQLAVRLALGASAPRLAQALIVEAALASTLAGLVAIAVAVALRPLTVAFLETQTALADEVRVGAAELALAFGGALVLGMACALAAQTRASLLASSLAGEGRTVSRRGARRLRSALVGTQVALSIVLAVGAGLLIRSYSRMEAVAPGFGGHVFVADVELDPGRFFSQRGFDFDGYGAMQARLLDRLRALPGAAQAALANVPPLRSDYSWRMPLAIERSADATAGSAPMALVLRVSGGYFQTVGVPVLRGRPFDAARPDGDRDAVVVNETLARRRLGDVDAVGQRISLDGRGTWRTIVGVARDIKQHTLIKEAEESVYLPFGQSPAMALSAFVRTDGKVGLASAMRTLVNEVEPSAVVLQVRELEEIRRASLDVPRVRATLLAIFAAVALAITAGGLAGLVSYLVGLRMSELAVRAALGARPSRLVRTVLIEVAASVAVGVLLGIVGAAILGRVLGSILFEVPPHDILTFAASVLIVGCMVSAAALLSSAPLWRLNPMAILRRT